MYIITLTLLEKLMFYLIFIKNNFIFLKVNNQNHLKNYDNLTKKYKYQGLNLLLYLLLKNFQIS